MRGLVANPKGDIIPRPIKANFREGLTVLEYFVSTHGARKGLADTALRTADSGYLTRRLVDVSQDVIIRENDCGTERGIKVAVWMTNAAGEKEPAPDSHLNSKLFGRVLAEDVKKGRSVLMEASTEISETEISELIDEETDEVLVRSVLTCDAKVGVCALCYGRNLATGLMVDPGEAVGIIAAQSIGEPGTQLTMRTFHTGGVAGEDITHGLPRVVELFEARKPKGEAQIAELSGTVEIVEGDKAREIKVTSEDGKEEVTYKVPRRQRLKVTDGGTVHVGDQITEGSVNPHEILRVMGPRAVQEYMVAEIQSVYLSQGVPIHDKHIELIVRQMLRRVNVIEPNETDFLPGQFVERKAFEEINRKVVEEGSTPASARPVLMGITKASLATDSWLSAASFQETTRVLTDAAISGRSDSLLGLKENVIIGKLIPAGTGMNRYRTISVYPTEIPERMYAVTDVPESPLLDTPMQPFQPAVPPQLAGDGDGASAPDDGAVTPTEEDGSPEGTGTEGE
jgi:DNA-directed RNA polymerase subunit beta'